MRPNANPISVAAPLSVAAPALALPEPALHGDASLQLEVLRLRRMVHAMAEMLVECGVVDPAMVEGRLRSASEAPSPPGDETYDDGDDDVPSLKKVGFWARLFGRRRPTTTVKPTVTTAATGAIPTALLASDETVPVTKLPFEVQSLYDEAGNSMVGSGPKQPRPPTLDVPRPGTCNRCWRRALVNSGQVCARCAVQHG